MNRQVCKLLFLCLLALSTVSGCGDNASSQSPAATEPIPTTQPTPTPEPTPTVQPTATPIPGWEKFKGGGIEVWLPESYDGGNLAEDVDVVVQSLRDLGPDYEQIAQMIEQNPSIYVIWAFDSAVGTSGFLTNMNITTQQVLSAVTVDTYLDAAVQQLPADFQVASRETLTLAGRPAARLTIDFTIPGVSGKEAMYVIKDGTTMWAVTYGTGAEEWEQRLSDFEQSIRTLVIQP